MNATRASLRPILARISNSSLFALAVLLLAVAGRAAPLSATVSQAQVLRDFTGDGNADVFWRDHSTGANYLWALNGLSFSGVAINTVPDLSWQVAGIGDFNGDNRGDVLWRNISTGETYLWLNNGTGTSFTGAGLPTVSLNWEIVGTGDFNGDGKSDILWRNTTTGDNFMWLMNGSSYSGGSPTSVPDQNWQVAAVADFNGDGKADILWYNSTTGQVYLWLMNGASQTSAFLLNTVPDLNWQIAAAGNFYGNGHAAIVWRNQQTGEVYLWTLTTDATAVASGTSLTTVADLDWQIAGVGDVNGDGKADLFWRNNATGDTYVWLMNGAAISNSGPLSTVADLNWLPIVAPATSLTPVISSTAPTAASQAQLYTYNLSATDPAGGSVSYSLTSGPSGAAITGVFSPGPPPISSRGWRTALPYWPRPPKAARRHKAGASPRTAPLRERISTPT